MRGIRYGTIKHTTIVDNGIVAVQEQRMVNFETVSDITTYCESVIVKDEQHALAEFLRLLDDHKDGKIASFGIQCHVNQSGRVNRIEKNWTV